MKSARNEVKDLWREYELDLVSLVARSGRMRPTAGVEMFACKQPFNSAVYWCGVNQNATRVEQVSHGGRVAGSDIEAVPVG